MYSDSSLCSECHVVVAFALLVICNIASFVAGTTPLRWSYVGNNRGRILCNLILKSIFADNISFEISHEENRGDFDANVDVCT